MGGVGEQQARQVLLAAIGTYGLVSWSTAQRGYEIGVRLATGATRRDVLGLLTLTALVAGYVPGRRAAATDPVRALRVD